MKLSIAFICIAITAACGGTNAEEIIPSLRGSFLDVFDSSCPVQHAGHPDTGTIMMIAVTVPRTLIAILSRSTRWISLWWSLLQHDGVA
eukprot:scaffold5207_cov96-Skeletonema_dohrnii-CCMP3373.AAC.11